MRKIAWNSVCWFSGCLANRTTKISIYLMYLSKVTKSLHLSNWLRIHSWLVLITGVTEVIGENIVSLMLILLLFKNENSNAEVCCSQENHLYFLMVKTLICAEFPIWLSWGAISFFVLTRLPENNLLDFFIKNRDNRAFQFHGMAQSRCFIFCVRQTLTRSL